MKKAEKLCNKPTIVGCGLTGLAISRSLHNAGIPHILIGKQMPFSRPALGESLNLEGSLDLEALFPEYKRFFIPKSAVQMHVGRHLVHCHLNLSKGRVAKFIYRILGHKAPEGFLHVDRASFDAEIFKAVTTASSCHYIDNNVKKISYDKNSDSVKGLELENGEQIEHPSYVFDATNFSAILPREIKLQREESGLPQEVVYTHLSRKKGAKNLEPWNLSTHLIRLTQDVDGVEGVCWMIPLGDWVSIGISVKVNLEGDNLEADVLIESILDAYARRGMDLKESFELFSEPSTIPYMRHYKYDRAYGANWLLAGTTYRNVWFGTASGVAVALAAATSATRLLEDSIQTGARYQQLQDSLSPSHDVFTWIQEVNTRRIDDEVLHQKATTLVIQSVYRLIAQQAMRSKGFKRRFYDALLTVVKWVNADVSHVCKVYEADIEQHADLLYSKRPISKKVFTKNIQPQSIK